MSDVSIKVEKISTELNRSSDASKHLLSNHFDFNVENWGESLNRLNKSIDNVKNSDGLQYLPLDVQDALNKVFTLWSLSQWSSNRAFVNASRLKDIVDTPFKSFNDLRSKSQVIDDPDILLLVNEMEAITVNFDIVTKELMEANLDNVVLMIEYEAEVFFENIYIVASIGVGIFSILILGIVLLLNRSASGLEIEKAGTNIHGLMAYFSDSLLQPWHTVEVGTEHVLKGLVDDSLRNRRLAGEMDIDFNNLKAYSEKQQIIHTLHQLSFESKHQIKQLHSILSILDMDYQNVVQDFEVLSHQAIEKARKHYLSKHPGVERDLSFDIIKRVEDSLFCPEGLIAMVLEKLILNSLEAISKNGKISISLAKEKGNWLITVEDSGVGFDQTAITKAIHPFYSNKPGHQGIGLYLVSLLVLKSGGKVTLENPLSGGARVIIRLPVVSA